MKNLFTKAFFKFFFGFVIIILVSVFFLGVIAGSPEREASAPAESMLSESR